MISTTSLAVAVGAFYLSYRGLCVLLNSFFRKQLTVLNELEDLGKPRADGRKIRGTVVIAGCSFGGMWTARVCSDHFERVLVIDPEAWLQTDAGIHPEPPAVKIVGEDQMRAPMNRRKQILQYTSIHTYQCIGLLALRKVFPNWDKEFLSAGGLLLPSRLNLHYSGIPQAPHDHLLSEESKTVHYSTRAIIEPLIRRLLKQTCKNVDFIAGTVVGINTDPGETSKIASVSYKLRDDDNVHTEPTVLFIDCAGPTHSGLKWLADAGYGNVPEGVSVPSGKLPLSKLLIHYHPKMNYSTSIWPVDAKQIAELERIIPGGYQAQSAFFLYLSSPSQGNGSSGMGRFQDKSVTVLCGGWGNVELPRSPEQIVEFYHNMKGYRPLPEWVFSTLEVVLRNRDQATYENISVPRCSRVLYGNAVNLPSNYLAVGDAVARVNPVYGQGHSKCIMGVTILDSLLRTVPSDVQEFPSGLASKFFDIHERKVCTPMWDATKTQDYNYETTIPIKGESLSDGAFVRWFGHNLILAGTWDPEVAQTFNETQLFTKPSVAIFKPSIVAKVLWEGLTHRGTRM